VAESSVLETQPFQVNLFSKELQHLATLLSIYFGGE